MSLGAGFRKAMLASLLGWVAGLLAALPFQIVEAVRVAGSNLSLLSSELGLTIALWVVLSFCVASFYCGFFLFPVAWLVSPNWILRHRLLWIALSACFGVALIAVRAHVWTSLDHDGVSLINFWMWGVYSATFCIVTSSCYARLWRR